MFISQKQLSLANCLWYNSLLFTRGLGWSLLTCIYIYSGNFLNIFDILRTSKSIYLPFTEELSTPHQIRLFLYIVYDTKVYFSEEARCWLLPQVTYLRPFFCKTLWNIGTSSACLCFAKDRVYAICHQYCASNVNFWRNCKENCQEMPRFTLENGPKPI